MLLPWENLSVSCQEETKGIEAVPDEKVNMPLAGVGFFLVFFHFYISISSPHPATPCPLGKVK